MKRIKLLAVVLTAFTFAFSGCTKSNEELIIGKWQVTRYIGNYTASGYSDEAMNTSETWDEAPELSIVITFKEDNTVTSVQTDTDGGEFSMDATYTLDGDKLTIKYAGYGDEGIEKYTITKLDKKEFRIRSSETFTEDYEGEEITIVYEETTVMKRL